jgi:hypothetical protein
VVGAAKLLTAWGFIYRDSYINNYLTTYLCVCYLHKYINPQFHAVVVSCRDSQPTSTDSALSAQDTGQHNAVDPPSGLPSLSPTSPGSVPPPSAPQETSLSMAAGDVSSRPSTADGHVFTIKAATLKFETRDDILPYLQPLIDNPDVEEVHLSGNTYGVEACKFLAEILAAKKNLKVALGVLLNHFLMI